MTRKTIGIVVACASLAAACGGAAGERQERNVAPPTASAKPAAPKRPAACALITQQEIEGILGGPVAAPESRTTSASTSCTYLPPAEGSLRYARVTIDWTSGREAMAGAKVATRLMARDADGVQVADDLQGLGDEATILIGGVLNVRKGDTLVEIDLRMQPEAREKGIALARKLLTRID
jgi:hypothetical protein